MNAVRRARALLLLPLIVGLAACGFHLQGQRALPDPLHNVFINTLQPFSVATPQVEMALRSRLRRRGATIAGNARAASSVLELSGVSESSRVLSIGTDGRAIEFEVIVEATFALRRGEEYLIPPQELVAARALSFPSEQILPKEAEERRLRNFLQDELADRIMLQLEVRLKRLPETVLADDPEDDAARNDEGAE